ncbi:unnamed protein product [Moneuplotes crassus]|uniref:Uncharacterized protein n=1 Tax=Euplotes crassus TaxID=5936 RepID=A0AAD1Y2H5_EUPCR|nr:unnamed protein product [Moneuplotes crassus]
MTAIVLIKLLCQVLICFKKNVANNLEFLRKNNLNVGYLGLRLQISSQFLSCILALFVFLLPAASHTFSDRQKGPHPLGFISELLLITPNSVNGHACSFCLMPVPVSLTLNSKSLSRQETLSHKHCLRCTHWMCTLKHSIPVCFFCGWSWPHTAGILLHTRRSSRRLCFVTGLPTAR